MLHSVGLLGVFFLSVTFIRSHKNAITHSNIDFYFVRNVGFFSFALISCVDETYWLWKCRIKSMAFSSNVVFPSKIAVTWIHHSHRFVSRMWYRFDDNYNLDFLRWNRFKFARSIPRSHFVNPSISMPCLF